MRYIAMAICSLALVSLGKDLLAGQAPCQAVSAGAETDALTGSVQNVGQAIIGRADNGTVFMHAGLIPCLPAHLSCLLGDVNGDDVIDGLDISGYVDIKLTGVGTPRELCAADIDIATFISLLLGQ